MKKLITMLLTIAVITSLLTTFAFAAEVTETALTVRVNGDLVQFPDGQPYINSDNRTLIPVRFATEALGANVTWVPETSTAVMEKNGVKVEVTIGNADIKVTDATGTAKTVAMDTVAVLRYDRTYVPIRFVAENLGAWVSYSDYYNTVQIDGCDTLTAAEIKELHAMTAKMWEFLYAQPMCDCKDFAPIAGTQYGQENLNEWIYRNWNGLILCGTYGNLKFYPGMSKASDFARLCIDEATKNLETSVKVIGGMSDAKVTFKSDAACVIRNPQLAWAKTLMYVIPGYVTIEIPANATAEDISFLNQKFVYLQSTPDSVTFEAGKTVTFKVAIGGDTAKLGDTMCRLSTYLCRDLGLYA